MPVFKHPKKLIDLSIDAICNIVIQMLTKGVNMTERTDDAVQTVEDKMEEVFLKRNEPNSQGHSPELVSDAKTATLDLLTVKHMVEKHGDFPSSFIKYIKDVPAAFANEILARVLNNFFKVVGDHDEDQVEKFMDEKWSFPQRIRVAFRILLRCLLSSKIWTFNMNQLTNKYYKLFAKYLIKSNMYEDDDYMEEMKEKNKDVFINVLICFKDELTSLTSISVQNLADGELLWLICCQCPNLWYLDMSQEMYDLQRYCVYDAAAGSYVSADEDGFQRFEEADFVDALCGLYGNNGKNHSKYEGLAEGCFKLKTLLLPNYIWEEYEENTLLDEMMTIFQQLTHLEEVTGVCLLYVLCKLNECTDYPLMLKLKKFDGRTGGHRLIGIAPKRLKKVKLPLVKEVNFSLNVFMQPVTLELFPNMEHLKVTPYDSRAYNFDIILPYLRNLVTLDIEFFQEMSISNMCDLASQCRLLRFLSVTCPALRMEACVLSDAEILEKETKRVVAPPSQRIDMQEKQVYEPVESTSLVDIISDYPNKLSNIGAASYENENSAVPDFSSLRTLQFFDMTHIDNAALFKCIKGSPALQTFTVAVNKLDPDSNEQIDDDFVGRMAPLLRCLREVTFAAENGQNSDDSPKTKLTSVTVAHLIHFCQDLRSISKVADWDITPEEVKGLNYYFKKKNFVLRLH